MSTSAADAAYAAETNLPKILGVLTTFFIIAVTIVGLRLYTRVFSTRTAGLDDLLISVATLCQTTGWIIVLVESKHGLGRHQSVVTDAQLEFFLKTTFLINLISIALGTMFLKLSIAANLLRICKDIWYKYALWFTMLMIVVYELVGAFFLIFRCKPVAGSWDSSLNATCAPNSVLVSFGLVNTSFNMITDVFLGVLPIPIIWRLHMKKSIRLYLIGILSLGYLAISMDIVKTYYQETYTATTDETYGYELYFYGFMENYIGMAAASAPMLRPLIGKALGISTTDSNYYYQYNGNSRSAYGAGRSGNGRGGAHFSSSNVRSRHRSMANRAPPAGTVSTLGGGGTGSFELDERETDSDGISGGSGFKSAVSSGVVGGAHAAGVFPKHSGESEENILQPGQYQSQARAEASNGPYQGRLDFKGITKTTEVIVD